MKVSLDYTQLSAETKRAALKRPEIRAGAWKIVKAKAFSLERGVKFRMPVDTGHARANWGHGPAGVWDEDEADLSITEGTTVVYVPRLNEGWSQQAPAGFIDAEVLKVEMELNAAINRLIAENF